MKCTECGKEIRTYLEPCEHCGHIEIENDDLDELLQDMLEEEDYEPTFPKKNKEGRGEDEAGKGRKQSIVSRHKKKSTMNKKVSVDRQSIYVVWAIKISRYMIIGSIILFFIAIFMPWFALSGNGVNTGYIRSESGKEFMPKVIQEHRIEDLITYQGVLVNFSGKDLYMFSKKIDEAYLTIHGVDNELRPSMVAKVHQYYMKAVFFLFLLSGTALVLLLLLKDYKGITIVRNLGIVNLLIVGVNYLAMKVTFFNLFIIEAKDQLGQLSGHPKVAIKQAGIRYMDELYPYVMKEEVGFYLAIIALGIWLITSIVLSEIKNRDEEIAIENGEID